MSWPSGTTNNENQNDFLDTFNDLNFEQLVKTPTHVQGGMLDLLLTNCPEIISNINIKGENEVCKSDHFAIEFVLDINISRKNLTKRKVFNLKKPIGRAK